MTPVRNKARKIGLLGGSFNPAHEGHRHISLIALRRLGLDEIWWLVSPQNPLKSAADMAPFEQRYHSAEAVARHPRIKVMDLETRLGTTFTADLLAKLKERDHSSFVWLMGGDNLMQVDQWKNWREIFETVPVAVIARPGFEKAALGSRAAHVYRAVRLDASDSLKLALMQPPCWTVLQEQLTGLSSTEIRKSGGSWSDEN